jgi:amino acid permease
MESLLKIIWYAAWIIGACAFVIAWLNTVGVLLKAFSALSKVRGDYLQNQKRTEDARKESANDSETLSPERIRRISMLVFFVCTLILFLITLYRSGGN